MNVKRFLGDQLDGKFLVIMSIGFAWYLLGLQLSSSSKVYHQLIQILFWVPGFLYLFVNPQVLRLWLARLPLFLLGFAAWSMLSVLWAQGDTRIKEVFYLLLAFNSILVLAWLDQERLWKIMAYAVLVGGGLAWYGIGIFFLVDGHDFSERLIGPGALEDTIIASHYMGALGILLYCFRGRLRQALQGWVWLLSLSGYCAYLLLSKSKGPIISLLIALLFLLVIIYRRRALLLVAGICAALLAYAYFFPEYALRGGMSYRPEVWDAAVEVLRQNPFAGIGLNVNYLIVIPSLEQPLHHAHNFFLHLAIQFGLIGLFGWGCVQYAVLLQARQHFAADKGRALVALSIFAFLALLTDGEGPWVKPNETWFTFWLPVFMALGLGVKKP
ncbi:O-antigen ligase family protein [Azomonas macrocytogenes]|uniref:O-antigen ligase n=1 Tax=Azomonas macrocytogenes TaxID=69962 RepID=A0A839T478_AZOMA|nr:O-antigen ligase family protein [Azomonas macrocytogenes]MBB3102745.1 O-antigen ligase [Azomonas macrocytogenes]